MSRSLLNFADATTAQLSWHMQNYVAITRITLELRLKNSEIDLRQLSPSLKVSRKNIEWKTKTLSICLYPYAPYSQQRNMYRSGGHCWNYKAVTQPTVQVVWKSGTRGIHLRLHGFQMNCSDLTSSRENKETAALAIAAKRPAFLNQMVKK